MQGATCSRCGGERDTRTHTHNTHNTHNHIKLCYHLLLPQELRWVIDTVVVKVDVGKCEASPATVTCCRLKVQDVGTEQSKGYLRLSLLLQSCLSFFANATTFFTNATLCLHKKNKPSRLERGALRGEVDDSCFSGTIRGIRNDGLLRTGQLHRAQVAVTSQGVSSVTVLTDELSLSYPKRRSCLFFSFSTAVATPRNRAESASMFLKFKMR